MNTSIRPYFSDVTDPRVTGRCLHLLLDILLIGLCAELEHNLRLYGKSILCDLSEKQIVIDGKKQRGISPRHTWQQGLVPNECLGERKLFLYRPEKGRRQIQ